MRDESPPGNTLYCAQLQKYVTLVPYIIIHVVI